MAATQVFEVTIDGVAQPGEHTSHADAELAANPLREQNHGKAVDVREKGAAPTAPQGTPENPAGAPQRPETSPAASTTEPSTTAAPAPAPRTSNRPPQR